MNRKHIISIVSLMALILLAACAPAATAANPVSNTAATVEPTAANGTDAVSPTAVNSTDTEATAGLACSNGSTSAPATPALTEGPYYKAGSPEQANLFQEGMAGTKIVITGYVYDTNCQPVANAWLDFWQADANGSYDNSGYTLRGHQFTDATGRYQLTTVVPGLYPGRTEHIHFKVQATDGQTITSQLFFPGVAQNDSDGIYNADLLLSIRETSDGLQGYYNFVVPAA